MYATLELARYYVWWVCRIVFPPIDFLLVSGVKKRTRPDRFGLLYRYLQLPWKRLLTLLSNSFGYFRKNIAGRATEAAVAYVPGRPDLAHLCNYCGEAVRNWQREWRRVWKQRRSDCWSREADPWSRDTLCRQDRIEREEPAEAHIDSVQKYAVWQHLLPQRPHQITTSECLSTPARHYPPVCSYQEPNLLSAYQN